MHTNKANRKQWPAIQANNQPPHTLSITLDREVEGLYGSWPDFRHHQQFSPWKVRWLWWELTMFEICSNNPRWRQATVNLASRQGTIFTTENKTSSPPQPRSHHSHANAGNSFPPIIFQKCEFLWVGTHVCMAHTCVWRNAQPSRTESGRRKSQNRDRQNPGHTHRVVSP